MKLIISFVASSRGGLAPQKRIVVMDVKGAFLHAAMRRKVCINLPEEATRGDNEQMVGLLKRAMYGTRDALQCWQEHVKGLMEELGFAAGTANPCVYRHRTRNLVISVHVDEFICAGPRADLDWVRKELAAHCQCTSILGPDAGEQKQVKYLSRILEWTGDGITDEHDPQACGSGVEGVGHGELQACEQPWCEVG